MFFHCPFLILIHKSKRQYSDMTREKKNTLDNKNKCFIKEIKVTLLIIVSKSQKLQP